MTLSSLRDLIAERALRGVIAEHAHSSTPGEVESNGTASCLVPECSSVPVHAASAADASPLSLLSHCRTAEATLQGLGVLV